LRQGKLWINWHGCKAKSRLWSGCDIQHKGTGGIIYPVLFEIVMQTEGFELIEHTADIGVVAAGGTLQEAFANAARGLFSIITDISNVRESESRIVEVKAADIECLLFNWMNELVYIFDVYYMLFSRFDVAELTDGSLKATCYGEKYDPAVHELKLGVKSATFHMLEVDRVKSRVQVIFDV
jgi:SHS2 domain-containing protein